MIKRYTQCLGIGVLILVLSGCQPRLLKEDERFLAQYGQPYNRITTYQKVADALKEVIIDRSAWNEDPIVVQLESGETRVQGPPDSIDVMSISAINSITSDNNLILVQNQDIERLLLEAKVGFPIEPYIPQYKIICTLSEFDKDIFSRDSGDEYIVYIPIPYGKNDTTTVYIPNKDGTFIPTPIEIGKRKRIDTDTSYEREKATSVSRMTIDVHITEVKTGAYYQGEQVISTIEVCTLEKSRGFSFVIYGSGITKWGTLIVSQGVHEAVRKLVNFAVLKLFAIHYKVPFEWAIESDVSEKQRSEWLTEWRQNFLSLERDRKLLLIQKWLEKYEDLAPVYVGGALFEHIPQCSEEYRTFGKGRVSQAFALRFLYQYLPESPLVAALEHDDLFQQNDETLSDLYIALLQNIPIN